MLGIVAGRARYRDRLCDFGMDKVSVTTLTAVIHETRTFQLSDELPYLRGHVLPAFYLAGDVYSPSAV